MKAEKEQKLQKRDEAGVYNVQLGLGYLKQGDTPRAKRKLLMALELMPDSADANGAMAYFLEKTGNITEARKFYQKAMSLAPESGSQLNNYGTFLCRSGNYAEADRYFLKAVKDANYVNSAGAYENAGLCATGIPDNSKAESYFVKALEQDSRRTQSLYELVSIELKQNDADKALAFLRKYQELALGDAALLTLAINAAHQAGKTDIEAGYRLRLSKLNRGRDDTGVKNEYDNDNA